MQHRYSTRFAAMLQNKLHVFCCPFFRTFTVNNVLSRGLHLIALEFAAFVVRERIRLNLINPSFFKNRMQFAREDVVLCPFYGSNGKECNLFTRSFCPIRHRSHLLPGNGARLRYSLGTNMNTKHG